MVVKSNDSRLARVLEMMVRKKNEREARTWLGPTKS
jgi:hypothetical protein